MLLSGPLTRLDWAVHGYVDARTADPVWWRVSLAASMAGNQYVLCAPLMVLCALAAVRFRTLRPFVVAAVVIGFLLLLVPGLKWLTGRTPPKEEVDLVFTTLTGRLESHTEYPSGHAVNAIVIWGMFLELARACSQRVQRRLRPWLRNLLIVLATAASGLGMVGLDYHWLSDSLAGWLLGAAILVAFLAVDPFAPLRRRRDALAEPPPDRRPASPPLR